MFITAGFTQPVFAQKRWVLVSQDVSKSKFYVDTSSIEVKPADFTSRNQSYVRCWVKSVLSPKGIAEHGGQVTQVLALTDFLKTRQVRQVQWATYSKAGSVVSSGQEESEWENLIPDSMSEAVFESISIFFPK